MDLLSLLVLLALGAVYWWMRREEKRNWVAVYQASGSGLETLYQRLTYLRAHGVRCRMKTSFAVLSTTASLQVHQDDLERAQTLLEQAGAGTSQDSKTGQ